MSDADRANEHSEELPREERERNLISWLHHLEAHPSDDVECVFELKLPISTLTKIMLRGERDGTTSHHVIYALLEREGLSQVAI